MSSNCSQPIHSFVHTVKSFSLSSCLRIYISPSIPASVCLSLIPLSMYFSLFLHPSIFPFIPTPSPFQFHPSNYSTSFHLSFHVSLPPFISPSIPFLQSLLPFIPSIHPYLHSSLFPSLALVTLSPSLPSLVHLSIRQIDSYNSYPLKCQGSIIWLNNWQQSAYRNISLQNLLTLKHNYDSTYFINIKLFTLLDSLKC